MAFVVLTGEIGTIKEAVLVGRNNFEKRDFTVEEIAEYPNVWIVQAQQGACNVLDNFKPGDKVIVSAQVQGRAWEKDGNKNYFVTLVMQRIQLLDDFTAGKVNADYAARSTQPRTQTVQQQNNQQAAPTQENQTDDLPF